MILAFCCISSSMPLTVFYWAAQHYFNNTQNVVFTSAEYRKRISSLNLPATLFLMQPKTLSALPAHVQLAVHQNSRAFPAKLLSILSANNLYWF